jgi:hypothetical protein
LFVLLIRTPLKYREKKLMQTIPQKEAEDLARSLPLDQSQSWGGAVYLVLVSIFVMWLLSRRDGARSLTFLEVEKNQDTTKNRINPWLAFGEFYAVVLLANWLSQWEAWLEVLIYLLGSGLIL